MILNTPDNSPLATSVPCIVQISIGAGAEHRMYGPFASMNDARDWANIHNIRSCQIVPLRRTDKERDINDFYALQTHDIDVLVDDFYPVEKYQEWVSENE